MEPTQFVGDASRAGHVVPVKMASGQAQIEELQRQACLQATTLSAADREAIQRRRAAAAERRRAMQAKAATPSQLSPLQQRIARRRSAMRKAEGRRSSIALQGSPPPQAAPASPDMPPPPVSMADSFIRSQARKSRRITMSAMADALADIDGDGAAEGIQASQSLAASLLGDGAAAAGHFSPRFTPRTSIGKKRSFGATRCSVSGPGASPEEALAAAAALIRRRSRRDSLAYVGGSLRTSGFSDVSAASGVTAASAPAVCAGADAGLLPPPPSRKVKGRPGHAKGGGAAPPTRRPRQPMQVGGS